MGAALAAQLAKEEAARLRVAIAQQQAEQQAVAAAVAAAEEATRRQAELASQEAARIENLRRENERVAAVRQQQKEREKRLVEEAQREAEKKEQERLAKQLREQREKTNNENFRRAGEALRQANAGFTTKFKSLHSDKKHLLETKSNTKAKAQAAGANIAFLHDDVLHRQQDDIKTKEKDLAQAFRQYVDMLKRFENCAEELLRAT